ncbi:MAG: hypothetical protein LBB73_08265 [Dysgonamonadaceae bacterium]|jgi:hypothetical protein|nr:hypothetical protein [Dysgonamonadaceae bacterium]
MASDWLPKNHEALYNRIKQTLAYLAAPGNFVRMGFALDSPQRTWLDDVFDPACTTFMHAYEAWLNPATRTSLMATALASAEAAFTPLYRQLYTGFMKTSPLVTDEDLVAMGFPKRSGSGHTPVPPPDTVPAIEIRLPSPAVVEVHFRNVGTDKGHAKPKGVHGIELLWGILDTPPAGWEDLPKSSFDTHTPFRFSFKGEERGKILYLAGRWENTRGEKGPWGAIQSVIIP